MRDTMQLFQILDEENSGLLPRHKFDKGLLCLGLGVSEEEVRAMLKDLNVGADDLVDYEVRDKVSTITYLSMPQRDNHS